MSLSYASLTLYAVLSGIEEDLRDLIRVQLTGQMDGQELLGKEVQDKCKVRLQNDIGFADDQISINDLIIYLDYSDSFKVLNANSKFLPTHVGKYIKEITPTLEKLVPTRNRVAHSRPLNFDDFPKTMDVAQELIGGGDGIWANLNKNLKRLQEEPSFVLGLKIPTYEKDISDFRHNLPVPDFNDTGFLGREKQIEELIKRCLSPQYPVITIVGEGGIGKTALAQKVAYSILDRTDCLFEAVVWTTSKTTQITAKEITKLKGAISDSLGILQDVADRLVPQGVENSISEIKEYLSTFPILIILDNLETVLDERIIDFLTDIPSPSKVLVTSRIGLGNAEFRIKLEPMNDQETLQLLRRIADIQGVAQITKAENKKLLKYCHKMSNNPGFIKWFVSAVKAGSRPEEILDNSHIFYDFCMSNIYDYLNEDSHNVLKSMQYLLGRHNQAKLAYFNQMEAPELEKALHELMRTNMVSMTSSLRGTTYESQYELSELAFGYLQKHHPLKKDEVKKFEKLRRQLTAVVEQVNSAKGSNPYSHFNIVPRSSSDYILVKYLKDALNEAYNEQYEIANNLVIKARRLAPEYYEVHRVEAMVQEFQGHIPAARDAFEAALDLAPKHAPLKVWYGQFLFKHFDDTEGALEQYMQAEALDTQSVYVRLHIARTNLYLMRFEATRDILDELKDKIMQGGSSEYLQRMFYDLHLQYFQRKADLCCSQQDRAGAVECLTRLKNEFQQCPPILVDKRMQEILRKAGRSADSCAYSIQDKNLKARVKRLSAWLAEHAA